MDDHSFDRLARALGGASTRRGAVAALASIVAGLVAGGRDARAKKGRRKCDPRCAAGQTCRQGACACDNGGAVCGTCCCTGGQTCQGGTCADPLPQCLAFGAACKDTGRVCCDGTVCASGQGGEGDVGCYAPAGVACQTTAECVYDATCTGGVCVANPQPTPAPRCTVCASGCPHTTIEAAIAAASAGDVISIAAGAYAPAAIDLGYSFYQYLTVEKALTLKACEPGGTVTIKCPHVARGSASVVACITAELSAGHLILEGLTLDTSVFRNYGAKAVVCSSPTCTITDCRLTNVTRGVQASANAEVSIDGLHIDSVQNDSVSGSGLWKPSAYAAITCTSPVTYTTAPVSGAEKCNPENFPGCGC